uniref:Uncharacterized protein n=1 Tax=Chromera velia CCMP2878 TaxID=1169474 RepID=A0A0G4HM14_9ALVE|eukprot:Cvel_7418.t1-p1 / transcript=Cvel_7418.t1 / gene=Cvel_7418 / organism=Chromera_velia_CCMP2878 / gene_product=hypothetical protein / transcript_product=hypothetical protein / location=Cvel_scaffold387:64389-65711(+) / protein_length=441 / sequence_SO=supercontig / SO=protein_coding / is_pseudo=false
MQLQESSDQSPYERGQRFLTSPLPVCSSSSFVTSPGASPSPSSLSPFSCGTSEYLLPVPPPGPSVLSSSYNLAFGGERRAEREVGRKRQSQILFQSEETSPVGFFGEASPSFQAKRRRQEGRDRETYMPSSNRDAQSEPSSIWPLPCDKEFAFVSAPSKEGGLIIPPFPFPPPPDKPSQWGCNGLPQEGTEVSTGFANSPPLDDLPPSFVQSPFAYSSTTTRTGTVVPAPPLRPPPSSGSFCSLNAFNDVRSMMMRSSHAHPWNPMRGSREIPLSLPSHAPFKDPSPPSSLPPPPPPLRSSRACLSSFPPSRGSHSINPAIAHTEAEKSAEGPLEANDKRRTTGWAWLPSEQGRDGGKGGIAEGKAAEKESQPHEGGSKVEKEKEKQRVRLGRGPQDWTVFLVPESFHFLQREVRGGLGESEEGHFFLRVSVTEATERDVR